MFLIGIIVMTIAHFWNLCVVLLRSLLLMIWLAFLTTNAFAEAEIDEKALAILEKTSAYYQALESFRATYNLTISYPEDDAVQSSKMIITVRGQQYRLCYDQKEMITDGATIWVYDKELKEVTISAYDKTDGFVNFAELHNLYQQDYLFTYIGERVVHKTKNIVRDIVQLTPSNEDNSCTSIVLEIDRATSQIHKWEIVDNEETRYICTVINFAVNIRLSDDYFTFDLSQHQDLEVIDLRESSDEDT